MRIDVNAIVKKANALERKVRFRNYSEWAACAFLVVYCLVRATGADVSLELAGYLTLTVGAVFVAVYLFAFGRAARLPDPSIESSRYLEAYRRHLTAQARLLRTVPLWYLAPLSLGAFALVGHAALELSRAGRGPWPAVFAALVVLAVFVGVWILNIRKARALFAEASSLEEASTGDTPQRSS